MFQPFSPTDTFADTWCKLQTLKSTEPIKVTISTTNGGNDELFSFRPPADKPTPRNVFMFNLARALLNPRSQFGIRRLSTCQGVDQFCPLPDRIPKSAYRYFDGELRMEVSGVDIQGFAFTVMASFVPNPGVIAQDLTKKANILHLPAVERNQKTRSNEQVEVAYPWTDSIVTLYSDDPHLNSK